MGTLYIHQRKRIRQDEIVHLRRTISGKASKIYVSVGDEVMPGHMLGEGLIPAGFRTVNLAKELRLPPLQAANFLKKKIGQTIYEGELLAEKVGTFGLGKKMIQSPVDGTLDFYDDQAGILRMQLLPRRSKLVSGVFGVVDKVDKIRSQVVIRTCATVIYGVFGSGKEREGMLEVLGSPEDLVSSRQISPDMHNKIVVGGGLLLLDALKKAQKVGVSGVISGGINAQDFRCLNGREWLPNSGKWVDVGMTLVVTEGFGPISIGEDLFAPLKAQQGRFAMIDGNKGRLILPTLDSRCMMTICNTHIPLGPDIEPTVADVTVPLVLGQRVRILCEPLWGIQGIVEAIDKMPTKIPSGLSLPLVIVATRQKKWRVPYTNLEAIT